MDKKLEIYNSGKKLFRENGFKSTNISRIMKSAGMATGTFYNYYSSKEELFMEIYMEENSRLKKQIMNSINLEANPMEVMNQMMVLNMEGMMNNPILKEWYNREIFSKIEKKFREDKGLEKVDFLYDSFIEIVKKWQDTDKMRSDIDANMIMAIFTALINIETHKEEIGFEYFPEIMEYMAGFVMKGLTEIQGK